MKTQTIRLSLLVCLSGSWAEARPAASFEHCFTAPTPYFVEAPLRLPSAVTNEAAGTSTTGVNLVDVDNDGDLDLFVAQGTASLDPRSNELFINNGRGWFTDESATRLPQGNDANSTKADFADIDADGDLDAIVANVGPEQLLVNDGTGHFSDGAASLPPAPDLLLDISSNAHFADLDQDGCPDILIANENPFDPSPLHGAQNRILINDCNGHFRDETTARLLPVTDQSAALLTGDIDMDGDPDILVLNRGQELVYVNNGNGYFQDETATQFPVTVDSTRSGTLVDVDRNGTLDLVTSNSRGEPPRLFLNDGTGYFSESAFNYAEAADETDTELQWIDLNCDKYPELLIANVGKFDQAHGFEGGPNHFFDNRHGHFVESTAQHARFPTDLASTAAAFGDIDGDGDADLVLGATGDGNLGRERLFIQVGRGCRHQISRP